MSMCLQVFLNQYNLHTYSYWHIPAHSDMPAHSYRYCMSLCCRYFFQIPTDMASTFWHTYTYLPTGSLMPQDGITAQTRPQGLIPSRHLCISKSTFRCRFAWTLMIFVSEIIFSPQKRFFDDFAPAGPSLWVWTHQVGSLSDPQNSLSREPHFLSVVCGFRQGL